MKRLTLDILEAVEKVIEKVIEEDPSWIEVRRRVKKAVDNQPKSVTLEEALKQVKKL
jgi:hypothetical protein